MARPIQKMLPFVAWRPNLAFLAGRGRQVNLN